jgi:hypothetical protein
MESMRTSFPFHPIAVRLAGTADFAILPSGERGLASISGITFNFDAYCLT